MTKGRDPRVRAPESRGRNWLNTGGRPLTLADLRGKIVLLDFDFRQIGLVEDVGEVPDQDLVDTGFFVRHGDNPILLIA